MDTVITLNGQLLTMEQVVQVAYGAPGQPRLEISSEARGQIERAAAAVQTLIQRGEVAYGISTGFGAFKDRLIPPDQVELLQRNILVSHAVGVGEPFDIPTKTR